MKKIVVIRISFNGELITVGLFPEEGGESRATFTFSSKLFPLGIQIGDELVFNKKAAVIAIQGRIR